MQANTENRCGYPDTLPPVVETIGKIEGNPSSEMVFDAAPASDHIKSDAVTVRVPTLGV